MNDKKSLYRFQQQEYWRQLRYFADQYNNTNVSSTLSAPKVQTTESVAAELEKTLPESWTNNNTHDPRMGPVDWIEDDPDERILDYFEHIAKKDQLNAIFNDEEYSSIISKFTSNQRKQRDLFIRKHTHYGASNILDGDCKNPININESLFALYVRMQDKLNRFKNLIENDVQSDETMIDTLNDLANYANIGIIVKFGEWTDD